jgi:hypothetical protein
MEACVHASMGLACPTLPCRLVRSRECVSTPLFSEDEDKLRLGPYYLVRAGRTDEVEKTLHRLARPGHYSDLMIKQQIALMTHTNEQEKIEAKNGSYAECFKGSNRRRTEIVGMAWTTQLFNGSHMSSYAILL